MFGSSSSVRLVSLAAQKFISDIANDALQHCKMRGSGQSSRKSGKVSIGFGSPFMKCISLCAARAKICSNPGGFGTSSKRVWNQHQEA